MSDCSTSDIDDMGAASSMQLDLDGDGHAETTVIDFDGDGVVDAYNAVDPLTGAELIVLDADGDGLMDTAIVDFDGDGTLDAGATDSDGDGMIDTLFDPNSGSTGLDTTSSDDGVDPFDAPLPDDGGPDDDDGIHGEPMAEIPYHQAQIGPNDCLPTSVAMVLTEITGEEVPQADLVALANELDLLGPTGMSAEGGVELLAHYGVEAEVQTGSVDDLRAMLDAGKPVIIGLDADDLYGVGDGPFEDDLVSGHAVVITGIDDEAGLVYINDPGFPDGAGVAIPLDVFEDAWVDADNTMIVADAPDTETGIEGEMAGTGAGEADGETQGEGRIFDLVLLPFNLVLR